MTAAVTPMVTLHVWRVPARDVAAAVAAGRLAGRRLRRRSDVRFAKVLGTASARFVPWAATPRRWAILTCWTASPDLTSFGWWDEHCDERAVLSLRTLSVRGTWDGCAPFVADAGARWDGRIVVLTRATLRPLAAVAFYRAVSPVARELRAAAGCRTAFGVGEAPLLRQGTISIWDSADAMSDFAYRSPQHRRVVDVTPSRGWYREELFARFALLHTEGVVDGTPLVSAEAA